MTRTRTNRKTLFAAMLVAAAGIAAPGVLAQDASEEPRDERGRRITEGITTKLAFQNVSVDDLIPFIVDSTGKVVIPTGNLQSLRVTVISDRDLPQAQALDMVFYALQQNGVSVVENFDRIILGVIEDISRQDVPVIPSSASTLGRTDYGTIAEKVFQLRFTTAEDIADLVEETVPDFAKVGFNEQSNTVVVLGNIALLQRVEGLVNALDVASASTLETRTFMLRFADAETVAENITDLYEDDGSGAGAASRQQGNQNQRSRWFGGGGGNTEGGAASAPSENLRVTANAQQNSVTVLAEEDVIEQVADLIANVWDQPVESVDVVPRLYTLQHTDPVKVQEALEGLYGEPSADAEGGGATAGATRLAGQFSFQALPDSGQLLVVAKSTDNLSVIDETIAALDRPQQIGIPEVIELRHADAEELAEQLNALLSQQGTEAQIPRQDRGLDDDDSSASPFADNDDNAAAGDDETEFITFWWQQGQEATDARPSSSLIGRVRIVPVWRQNAVLVTAPPELRAGISDLVRSLDRPGRQVLIKAVVAEISLEDALALGLRWSSDAINTSFNDNTFSIGTNTTGTQNDLLPGLFDTSVLNLDTDLNVVLQALDQTSDLNILSEPKIFTSDNQEAEFFDGQDIPFITDSQTTDQGTLTQSTEYRAVGIQLRVRPRITPNRDVDLRVNLELSSIQPVTTSTGQFIVDRRETTTQLIVGDGQTIVISGIMRSEDREVVRKIPFLGDLPLIGAIFTSTDTEVEQTELVAFVTPYVIENETDLQRVNDPYRSQLREMRERLGAPDQDEYAVQGESEASALDANLPAPLDASVIETMSAPALREAFSQRSTALERSDITDDARARLIAEQREIRQRLDDLSGF